MVVLTCLKSIFGIYFRKVYYQGEDRKWLKRIPLTLVLRKKYGMQRVFCEETLMHQNISPLYWV